MEKKSKSITIEDIVRASEFAKLHKLRPYVATDGKEYYLVALDGSGWVNCPEGKLPPNVKLIKE